MTVFDPTVSPGTFVWAACGRFRTAPERPFYPLLTGLGTTDPEVVGQLWNDSGTVKISAGPPTYSLTI